MQIKAERQLLSTHLLSNIREVKKKSYISESRETGANLQTQKAVSSL